MLTFVQVTDPATIARPARRGRRRRHRRRGAPRRPAAGRPRRCHRGRADQAGRRPGASAMPITVHVEPALLAALRQRQPALADRFAAVLETATVMSAPQLPLDPSAAAAADQRRPVHPVAGRGRGPVRHAPTCPAPRCAPPPPSPRRSASPAASCCATSAPACCCCPPTIYDSLGGQHPRVHRHQPARARPPQRRPLVRRGRSSTGRSADGWPRPERPPVPRRGLHHRRSARRPAGLHRPAARPGAAHGAGRHERRSASPTPPCSDRSPS